MSQSSIKKQLLITKAEQDEQWMEHIQDVLNQQDPPTTYDFSHDEASPNLDVNLDDITHNQGSYQGTPN